MSSRTQLVVIFKDDQDHVVLSGANFPVLSKAYLFLDQREQMGHHGTLSLVGIDSNGIVRTSSVLCSSSEPHHSTTVREVLLP